MTNQFVVAPMLVVLVTAVLTLVPGLQTRTRQAISLAGAAAYVLAVAVLFTRVVPGGIATYQESAWPAPFGITLVADSLSAFMLALTALVAVPALVFAVRSVEKYGQRLSFHPLFHLLLLGVTGAFLTGDLFNLFVWFEVLLLSSYALVAFYSGAEHTRAAMRYAVLNLVGSAFMLVAIGGIYATTGTLNMADIARRLAAPEATGVDPAPVLGLSAILFAVFALKAGLVPLQFWVPAAYRAAPAPVSAMLAGVVKKVGVYAVVRLYFTVFAAGTVPGGLGLPGVSGRSFLAFFAPVMFLVATASVAFGGLAAIAADDLDDVLSYSSIGQVGFIFLPLAVGAAVPAVRQLAIVAALVYALNHAVAKGLLFLTAGAIRDAVGTDDLRDLGGLLRESPTLSGAFFVGALALVGIPPLSGFFGKLFVFDTAVQGRADAVLAVALVGAVLTILYLSRAWNRGFWGPRSVDVERARPGQYVLVVLVALALALAVIGVGFEPVLGAAEAAARAALARGEYIDAVDLTGVSGT